MENKNLETPEELCDLWEKHPAESFISPDGQIRYRYGSKTLTRVVTFCHMYNLTNSRIDAIMHDGRKNKKLQKLQRALLKYRGHIYTCPPSGKEIKRAIKNAKNKEYVGEQQ